MSSYYQSCWEEAKLAIDTNLMAKMKKSNSEELSKLEARLEDAQKNLGETEIFESLLATFDFFCKIGDKVWFEIDGRKKQFLPVDKLMKRPSLWGQSWKLF